MFFVLLVFVVTTSTANAQTWGGDEQYIKDLYQTYLGHAPDLGALHYYISELSSGRNRDDVKAEIADSREALSYKASYSPRIIKFNSQKSDSTTWSFSWTTQNTDATAFRIQCVAGVKAFFKNTTTELTCGDGHTAVANGSADLSFTNLTGNVVTISAKLYPMKKDEFFIEYAKTVTFSVGTTYAPRSPLASNVQVQMPIASPVYTGSSGNKIFNRFLGVGSSGDDVYALQTILESRRFLTMPSGVAKGYFGEITKLALAAYQNSVGIEPLGIVGPITIAHLNSL